MSELKPYTFMDQLYALKGVTDLNEKTKLLCDYCNLVLGAAESGKISWHQAAYELTATFRFPLDDVPGYTDLLDLVSGNPDAYGPTDGEIKQIKALVQKL